MAIISRLTIYPIKSLDGTDVQQATILPGGSLEHDREWALFDDRGRTINGKRESSIHRLRSRFDPEFRFVTLSKTDSDSEVSFDLRTHRSELATWLSQNLDQTVEIRQDRHQGFPDDTGSPGPTIVSRATLETVASWFPDLTVEQIRIRLRTNIELDQVPPFWEDRLFTAAPHTVPFRIGSVQFEGVNPCARCVVPTRDPITGQAYPQFQTIFIQNRKDSLPKWAATSRFDHYYRLTLNTRVSETEAGKILKLGDRVELSPA